MNKLQVKIIYSIHNYISNYTLTAHHWFYKWVKSRSIFQTFSISTLHKYLKLQIRSILLLGWKWEVVSGLITLLFREKGGRRMLKARKVSLLHTQKDIYIYIYKRKMNELWGQTWSISHSILYFSLLIRLGKRKNWSENDIHNDAQF